jgi:lipopolysaccharide exporter
MLAAQLFVGVGQFLYSAITARIFVPADFGAFAAALSLQGLLILITTTGLPSIVLKEDSLTRGDVKSIRLYSLVGGLTAAIAFVLLCPSWLGVLNAPAGTEFVPLLAIALIFGPIASIESAMLRREARSLADAITLIVAFSGSASIAVLVALLGHESWALALATALNPVILGIGAASARRTRYVENGRTPHRRMLRFASNVSTQNVVFLLIGQAPSWVISGMLGPSSLGQYSRASTLAGIPSTSLSTALSRAIQPYWRNLRSGEVTSLATRDAAVLTGSLAFPLFATLAIVGPDLTALWLGPGWDEARDLVPWLAVAFGLQVPFGVLASSLEMRAQFRPIRFSQLGLASGLLLGMFAFALTTDVRVAAAASALSQAAGLIALVWAMARTSYIRVWSLLCALGVPLLWAIGIGFGSWVGVETSHHYSWTIFGSSDLAAVISGCVLALLLWAGTFQWQPASKTLASRGVPLPRLLRRRVL